MCRNLAVERTRKGDRGGIRQHLQFACQGPYVPRSSKSRLEFKEASMLLIQLQKAAPHMTSGSRIILFSTTLCAASTVSPNYLAYVSSKGAVEQMTRVLSKDLAKKGIMVNCVAPGPTSTEMFCVGRASNCSRLLRGEIPKAGSASRRRSRMSWLFW